MEPDWFLFEGFVYNSCGNGAGACPNWPQLLRPEQNAMPSLRMKQSWRPPEANAAKTWSVLILTGDQK